MDGTLTESKRPLTRSEGKAFSLFSLQHRVAVISGASFPQIKSQLVSKLPKGKSSPSFVVLPLNGGEMWKKKNGAWKCVYKKSFPVKTKKEVRTALKEMQIKFANILPKKKWGVVVEDRGSQITYSALGSKAPLVAKHKWDPKGIKRLRMARYIKKLLPHCDVGVAGTTSIDVTPKGLTKEFGVRQAMISERVHGKETVFIGDAIFRGGNDAPAGRAGVKMIQVRNPRQTYVWMLNFTENAKKRPVS